MEEIKTIEDLEKRFAGMSDKERTIEFGLLGFTKKTIALMNTLVGTSANIRRRRLRAGNSSSMISILNIRQA